MLNAALRYDWIETSDGAIWDRSPGSGIAPYDNTYPSQREESLSPKFGIAFHPDDKTTLRASGGKGFRSPSIFELYKVHVRGEEHTTGRPIPISNPRRSGLTTWGRSDSSCPTSGAR
ncbi:MAG: TonB-dependent receptor [Deltaproteobacteria bacterium]|nr:TonB-dependent receptor [Deltaproteobacteria bacterium]